MVKDKQHEPRKGVIKIEIKASLPSPAQSALSKHLQKIREAKAKPKS